MGSSTEPADLPATDLVAHYADGSLSPVEVLASVRARVEAAEPTLGALWLSYSDTWQEAALASAERWRAGERVGPLDGVPITLKENIATEGVPVPLGCAATELVPAAADAPPAARVREAGTILLGKTTMPDLGMLTSGVSSLHGLTRNPWNPAWNPGGSSSGAAAAAGAGYGPLHLGTDIGGSIRLPASWTGLFGFKPSNGRVPIDPPYHGRAAGPLTRTVADAALLMGVLAQPDWRDYRSLPATSIDFTDLESSVRGLRIGLLHDAGAGLPVHPEVAAAVSAAAGVFESAGAIVEPVEPFFTQEILDDLDLFWRVRGWEQFRSFSHERQNLVLPYIADWCRGGADVPGVVVMRCVNRMLEAAQRTVAGTQDYDFVLSPVSPVPAVPAELPSPTNDVAHALEHIGFTVPYNMSEQPAASINCGATVDGRPIGVQIAGRRFDDPGVLRMARFYEQARPAEAAPDWSRCRGWESQLFSRSES
ncbi:MAG TPA: amidase [Pseudonocardiaceae bacterium]|jgi:aspartyl-tRNA(Asn)/glutamyl-tRNA(Gln) amidotransferase subunit A|nr:amidase [Pseudonocardiaceae bacterium]